MGGNVGGGSSVEAIVFRSEGLGDEDKTDSLSEELIERIARARAGAGADLRLEASDAVFDLEGRGGSKPGALRFLEDSDMFKVG